MTDDSPFFDLSGALPFDSDAEGGAPPASKPPAPGQPLLLSGEFAYIGQGLTAAAFDAYVQSYDFGRIPPDYVVLHHTAIPSTTWARYGDGAVWDAGEQHLSLTEIYTKRKNQLDQLMRFYRDTKGWSRGPHLFIDEHWIWLFTPMYDIGVHAASGNSYHDERGHLHYSIGIEIIGYYEHVLWPAAVARNVAMAVYTLKRRLRTFDYIDGPWAGKIGAHRMYNKPACPGAAIMPGYYMPILMGAQRDRAAPAPAPAAIKRYRVKAQASGGATIRAAATRKAATLGRLAAGQPWQGDATKGEYVTLPGFGSSNVWIEDASGRCVWSGLLEEVKP